MNDHHLIKEIEKEGQCVYCNAKLEGTWDSSFESRSHYKCIICKCGKENCVDIHISGTGHDSWSGLEKEVQKSNVKIVEKNVRIVR